MSKHKEGDTPSSRPWSKQCRGCDRYLSATEEHFYGDRCEDCERLEMARIEAWKKGAEDPELDERYSS